MIHFHHWRITAVQHMISTGEVPPEIYLEAMKHVSEKRGIYVTCYLERCTRKGCTAVRSGELHGHWTLEDLTKDIEETDE